MGLFIGTNERYVTIDFNNGKKLCDRSERLKSTIISMTNNDIDDRPSISITSFDGKLLYYSYHNRTILQYNHRDYYSCNGITKVTFFDHYFGYDERDNFSKITSHLELCELITLRNLRGQTHCYAIGLLIKVPTLDTIKQNDNYKILLSLYHILNVILCYDVVNMIFKKGIYMLTYQYYKNEYYKMIVQQPHPSEDCKQYTVNKRIETFDCCFKLWFDQHVNL